MCIISLLERELKIIFLIGLVLCLHEEAWSCDWTLSVINRISGETKIYKPDNRPKEFQLDSEFTCVLGEIHENVSTLKGQTIKNQTTDVICKKRDAENAYGTIGSAIVGQKYSSVDELNIYTADSTPLYRLKLTCM